MKLYATKANARRAARKEITDIERPEELIDYTIVERDGKFGWRRVQKAPKAPTSTITSAPKAPAAAEEPAPQAPKADDRGDCPSCGIGLSNGLLHFNSYEEANQELPNGVDGDTVREFGCMACGHEWGATYTKKSRQKGAVAAVWEICEANKDLSRKDVVGICVSHGINFYTARTQYQAWFKATNDSKK